MIYEIRRGVALGSKFGLKALSMYFDSSVETPEIDERAVEGAVGIVITLSGVMIALYITILVVGSMSKSTIPGTYNATSGLWEGGSGIQLPAAWNNTLTTTNTNAQGSFSLAGILPIAIIGVGVLTIIISAFAMR